MVPGGVRIDVAAAGVNRADLLQRRGLYPPPDGASPILGLECAGTVAEVGPGVTTWRPGDRVMALLTGGGYAEQVVVDQRCLMSIPIQLTDAEAGGFPEVFLTAHLKVFRLGGARPGSTVLVHGGSGGVGTAAILLAKAAGVTVIVTAGSDDRCRRCLDVGAHAAINYHTADFVSRCLELTDNRGIDVVVDCVGADYLDRHLDVLAPGGRLVVIALMGGAKAEIDLGRVLRKRLTVIGSTLRARSAAFKGELIRSFLVEFGDALDAGTLAPVVHATLPLAEAAEAHRLLAAGEVFGKVVLTP